jgi:hypothetical protein
MATYTKVVGGDGTARYKKNKIKFVKKIDVPLAVIEALKTEKEVDDTGLNTTIKFRKCICCDEHGKHERFLNGQTVYLCEEDYYSKSIGQVAQHIRGDE